METTIAAIFPVQGDPPKARTPAESIAYEFLWHCHGVSMANSQYKFLTTHGRGFEYAPVRQANASRAFFANGIALAVRAWRTEFGVDADTAKRGLHDAAVALLESGAVAFGGSKFDEGLSPERIGNALASFEEILQIERNRMRAER